MRRAGLGAGRHGRDPVAQVVQVGRQIVQLDQVLRALGRHAGARRRRPSRRCSGPPTCRRSSARRRRWRTARTRPRSAAGSPAPPRGAARARGPDAPRTRGTSRCPARHPSRPGRRPARRRPSRRSRRRTRSASSPAALRVKVSPSTWSGRVCPLATSQMTREAIVSVLPEPAPATTSTGPGGASMTATCSVGRRVLTDGQAMSTRRDRAGQQRIWSHGAGPARRGSRGHPPALGLHRAARTDRALAAVRTLLRLEVGAGHAVRDHVEQLAGPACRAPPSGGCSRTDAGLGVRADEDQLGAGRRPAPRRRTPPSWTASW